MKAIARWLTAGVAAAAASLTAAGGAFAHPAATHATGLGVGLLHPLTGLDHLLAMVAVGLWAAHRGGRERWLLPLTFLCAMAAGGLLGLGGYALPGIEAGVAVSVLLLGLLVAASPALPRGGAVVLVAAAALLHGHAHGSELAAGLSPALYAAGFLATTAALHTLGVVGGSALLGTQPHRSGVALRTCGAALALAGGVLVTALL